jgi:AcrR family transcriptional regulator
MATVSSLRWLLSIAYNAVMPAPARTSREAIVLAARALLEEGGLDAVVMGAVAERVGVRGPSLYKHVADRAALIRSVGDAVVDDLRATLGDALSGDDPAADLRALAQGYRLFVHANPNSYGLLFAHLEPDLQPDGTAVADLGRPIVSAVARLMGEESSQALEGGRTLVAWAHGFVSMELAGAFRLGGDLDAAYATGIDIILAGLSGRATPASG